ncbi:MAG: hypothetical protein LUE98_16025 [Tannerellaceae bacterium]|nr:hypothetical protein [Tannerellaceae bacterium]
MKNLLFKYLTLICLLLWGSGCSDFFQVDTDDVLDHSDYINEESEMYSGFLGIITKVQAIGDKSIYITDTRAEMLEPTLNAPSELYALYNYDTDLSGNSYADPAPYYDVILACNDYMLKMYQYRTNAVGAVIDSGHYAAMIAGAVRIKAWVYLTLAKIYGEAVWFDDPLREYKDPSEFKLLDFDQLIQACLDLLDKGFDGVSSDATMAWEEFIDPEASGSTGEYYYWDFMTPDYSTLYAELCLWTDNFQKAANLVLDKLNTAYYGSTSQTRNYLRNDDWYGKYKDAFWGNQTPQRTECVSVILYKYDNNQINSLKKHFSTVSPNQYMLAPSTVAMDRFSDEEFNNLGVETEDRRASVCFKQDSEGKYYIDKYIIRNSQTAYQDDMCIYIYRGADLYYMLIEAMNGLERYDEVSALMNAGIGGTFPQGGVSFSGFTDWWTARTPSGSAQYPDKGIRGVFKLGDREMTRDKYQNDLLILDEMMLEFPVEGKTLPAMIRMARRYGDANIIADRICPKYSNPDEIRAKILAGGYFIKWNHGVE